MRKNIKSLAIVAGSLFALFTSCKRDNYYTDGGLANPNYPATMMEYLEQKPVPFDTLAQVVKLAGLEEMFRKEDFTFFAPDDDVIKRTIGYYDVNPDRGGGLNEYLFRANRDTVKKLSDIDPIIWRKYLLRYMFRGVNRLKDYPQIDNALLSQFPGQLYYSYSGDVSNIGVIYNSANGVKYIGPRQLQITYVPDIANPTSGISRHKISSSDIKTTNGVVHTLESDGASFGFDQFEFNSDVYITGLRDSTGN
jgi:hypothetical protein